MATKSIQTRVQSKHDFEINWLRATFTPLKGEIIVYDRETDTLGNTLTTKRSTEEGGTIEIPVVPVNGRSTPYAYERFKIGDGINAPKDLPFAGGVDENSVRLVEDLYTYTAIGKITGASNTNPVRVAFAGENLKAVFNKVFGTQQDQQPTITVSRDIRYSYNPSSSLGATSSEVGTSITTNNIIVTVAASGSCSSTYGYYTSVNNENKPQDYRYDRAGVSLNYSVKQQTINGKSYKLKLTLPKAYYVTGTNTPSINVNPTPVYINGNDIYIDATSATLTIPNSITEQSTSPQEIYGAIKATCTFDELKDGNENSVLGFLTYLKESANVTTTITSALNSYTPTAAPMSSQLKVNNGSCFVYYAVTDTNSTPQSWTKYGKGQTSTTGLEINANAGQYVWVATYGSYGGLYLWNEMLGDYNKESALEASDEVELTFGTSTKVTYNCYRPGIRKSSGLVKLKLA